MGVHLPAPSSGHTALGAAMGDIMREWNEALTAPKCEHGHLAPVCDLCKKDAEIAALREDAERYRALKERHGYIMVVRLINADGYSSAKKDALIDAFADAAIADIAAWESLSEAQKALQLDAQAKRAEINAARKGAT